MSIYHGIHCA